MRLRVAVDGASQSVSNTGSHSTKTRISLPAFSLQNLLNCEGPRKQYAQVGESSVTTRTSSLASLNALRRSPKFEASSRVSGC
jgi:hypothetical protein